MYIYIKIERRRESESVCVRERERARERERESARERQRQRDQTAFSSGLLELGARPVQHQLCNVFVREDVRVFQVFERDVGRCGLVPILPHLMIA